MRKVKSYAITRRGSIHRQINKDPFFDKDAESKDGKINLITITSEKQLHNDRKK